MVKKIVGVLILCLLLLSVSASALFVRTGEKINIRRGTIINDNLFAAGSEVTVSGRIKGDVIAFGGEVTINGQVDGNVIVAGGDVVIAGSIKNDLLAGCGGLFIDKNARIGKDAFIGAGDVRLAGKVFRDLKVGSGSLEIMPGALVQGKLDYAADSSIISEKAKIVGAITAHDRPNVGKEAGKFMARVNLSSKIISFLAIFVIGLLIVIFLPNQVKLVTSQMLTKFWPSLGWGIVSVIVIPLAAFLLMITLIGIPLGFLLFFLYCFGIYIHGIFTSVVIGKAVFDRFGKPELNLIWALLLGLVILQIVGLVPLVGWFIKLILFLWAFGALVATRITFYKEAREKSVI